VWVGVVASFPPARECKLDEVAFGESISIFSIGRFASETATWIQKWLKKSV
jgi:hypothetical protein